MTSSHRSFVQLGSWYYQNAEYDNAVSFLRKTLKKYPDDADINNNLALAEVALVNVMHAFL